ncbi:hypothetical protein EMIT0P395_270015 [Pseudomonas sp. IT-P395]
MGELRRSEIPSRTQILKSPKIGPLSLWERAGVRGESNTNPKPNTLLLLTTQQDER